MEQEISRALERYQKEMKGIKAKRELLDSEERRLCRDLFTVLNQDLISTRSVKDDG